MAYRSGRGGGRGRRLRGLQAGGRHIHRTEAVVEVGVVTAVEAVVKAATAAIYLLSIEKEVELCRIAGI